MNEWQPLNKNSDTRLLIKFIAEPKAATTSVGGIMLGDEVVDKNVTFGKLAEVVACSEYDISSIGIKVGDLLQVGDKSGRSAIKQSDGSIVYIINQDEVWAYRGVM